MLVRKEVVRPGVYYYEDRESGLPRKLTVTPEKVKHYFDSGKAMLASGISIPVPIEHQPDSKPLTRAERSARQLLNNGGFVADFELTADNKLFSTLDIQDAALAKKLPSVRWTSPWITSFFDGDGKQWDEVIGHVALTTRPRITKQQPFPSIAAAMSFVGPLGEPVPDATMLKNGVSLSLAGLLEKKGGVLRPRSPMAFSLFSGAALALEDMPKKEEKPPAKKKPGGEKPPDEKPDGIPAPKGEDDSPGHEPGEKPGEIEAPAQPGADGQQAFVDPDGDVSIHDVLKDLLEAIGIILPMEACSENFEECLYKAAMEKVKGGGSMAPEPDMKDTPPAAPPGGAPQAPVIAESPPLYMSLVQAREKAKAIADPATRALLEAAFAMGEGNRKQSEALKKAAFTGAAEKRVARIERLVKRCRQPGFKEKLLAQASSATLSLGDDGRVVDSMDAALDLLEQSVVDLPQLLTAGLSNVAELGHPKEPEYGEMSEERRAAVVNEFCTNAHIKPLPKAS